MTARRRVRGFEWSPHRALIAVACLYVLEQLAVTRLRDPLGWDESIYISQVSGHGVAAWFDAPRARGVTLVAAPIVSWTSSVWVLRLWLTIVSALLLYACFRVWLRVMPSYAVPLAAVLFAGLWTTTYYGAQVMPNLYVAFGAVAGTGYVARALATGAWRDCAGAGVSLAAVALLRPSDAAWLLVGVFVALSTLVFLRRTPLRLASMVMSVALLGSALGTVEWVLEANARFGGVGERLRLASVKNGTHPTFSLSSFARSVNGPLLCRPCHGRSVSWIGIAWWFFLPPLIVIAILLARRTARLAGVLLATITGVALAAGYVFVVPYGAPRFLLPAYALLFIATAQGAVALLAWARQHWPDRVGRRLPALVIGTAAVFVIGQSAIAYHHQESSQRIGRNERLTAEVLQTLGLRPPCVIAGPVPFEIVYAAGCRNNYDAVDDIRHTAETRDEDLGDAAMDALTVAYIAGRPTSERVVIMLRTQQPTPPQLAQAGWKRKPAGPGYVVLMPPATVPTSGSALMPR